MFNVTGMRTLLAACVLLVAASCSKSPIDRAQAFLDAGMASQAVPLLQVEIQANPKNSRAHFLLGQAALALSDQAAAKESFDRAVLLSPNWAEKVGRAYLDAASKLLAEPTSVELAVAHLDLAREKTHALDKEIARALRRLGLRDGSPRLLGSAAQIDPALVQGRQRRGDHRRRRRTRSGFADERHGAVPRAVPGEQPAVGRARLSKSPRPS